MWAMFQASGLQAVQGNSEVAKSYIRGISTARATCWNELDSFYTCAGFTEFVHSRLVFNFFSIHYSGT